MANNSVNHLLLTNQQEKIQEYLLKAEAVAHVALDNRLVEHKQSIVYHYLWALLDIIRKAKNVNEQALCALNTNNYL